MENSGNDPVMVVRSAVAEAMFMDVDEVQASTRILGDLGAESIDLLDILFRVERATGINLEIGDLSRHFQGDLTDEQFYDLQGHVTPAGREQLQRAMPDLDLEALGSEATSDDLMKELTVQYIADRVTERAPNVTAGAS